MKKLTIILLAATTFNTYAQKLPKVQTTSMRAPANIKIDGKLDEWNDRFQAYNSGQYIYYTISNDDSTLYLTARMADVTGSKKILRGGIMFTVKGVKKADELSLNFPVPPGSSMKSEEYLGVSPLPVYEKLKADTIKNKAKIDSLVGAANNAFVKNYKQIYITGLPGLSDSLLSVYNTQNILVKGGYDKKMNYVYELAIPLKYLEAALADQKIKYTIKLLGYSIFSTARTRPSTMPKLQLLDPGAIFAYEDTEFSGEYILAK